MSEYNLKQTNRPAGLLNAVEKLLYWAQMAVPAVYGEELIYADLQAKTISKLNEVVEQLNVNTEWTVYLLDNGVEQETVNYINELIQNGTIASIINEDLFVKRFQDVDSKINSIDEKIGKVANGGPYGSYPSISSIPTTADKTKIYVITGEPLKGHWVYWSGTAWTDGGIWSAVNYAEIGEKTIFPTALQDDTYLETSKQATTLIEYTNTNVDYSSNVLGKTDEVINKFNGLTNFEYSVIPPVEGTPVNVKNVLKFTVKKNVGVDNMLWINPISPVLGQINAPMVGGVWINMRDVGALTYLNSKNISIYLFYLNTNGQENSTLGQTLVPVKDPKDYAIGSKYTSFTPVGSKTEVILDGKINDWIHLSVYDNVKNPSLTSNTSVALYVSWFTLVSVDSNIGNIVRLVNPFVYTGSIIVNPGYVYSNPTYKLFPSYKEFIELKNEIQGVSVSKVNLIKAENLLQIRSKKDSVSDYAINANLIGSLNGAFNLGSLGYLNSSLPVSAIQQTTTIKEQADDICPIYFNGSYHGGNHGDAFSFTINAPNHGKTFSDIGGVYKSSNGINYIFYSIPDSNTLKIISSPTGLDGQPFSTLVPTSPLTHQSGGNNTSSITFTVSGGISQVWPNINNVTTLIYNNNNETLTNNFLSGDYIDIIESYNIINTVGVYNYLVANVGTNTNNTYYSNIMPVNGLINNVYRFSENGTITVFQNFVPYVEINSDTFYGGVQSGTIGDYYRIPLTTYKVPGLQSNQTLSLDKSVWDSTTTPPNKFYQYSSLSNGSYGFMLGYDVTYGDGIPSVRSSNALSAGSYNGNSHKMYPYIFNGKQLLAKSLNLISVRKPIIYSQTQLNYYLSNKYYIIEIENNGVAGTINFDVPIALKGKVASIVQSSPGVELLTEVLGNFLRIKMPAWGSATLKTI